MPWAWVLVDLLCKGALLGAAGEVVAEEDEVGHQDAEAQEAKGAAVEDLVGRTRSRMG